MKATVVVPFKIHSAETKAFKDVQLGEGIDRKAMGIPDTLEVFEFKGYASTFGNVDRGADVVKQGAFADFLRAFKAEGDPMPALWQHDYSNPVGVYVDMLEDEKGLWVHGILPKSDSFVTERVIPQMQVGSVRKMSIGYFINDMSWQGEIRVLEKLGLYEVSLVTVPMNNEADVLEMKKDGKGFGIDDLIAMDVRALEKQLKDGICFSDKCSKTIISFLKSDVLRDALAEEGRDAPGDDEQKAMDAGWQDILAGIKGINQTISGG